MSDNFVKITDTGPKLDTSALKSAGKALLNSTPAADPVHTPASPTPSTTVPASSTVKLQSNITVEPVDQPVKAAAEQASEQLAEKPQVVSEGDVLDIPDTKIVRLTVNGQQVEMPWGEAKKQMMLHRTFTQNQQRLAQERKQFETERTTLAEKASRAEKLERVMTDPDLLARYAIANPVMAQALAAKFGTTVAAATVNADPRLAAAANASVAASQSAPQIPAQNQEELVNFGELNQVVGQRLAELQSRVDLTFEEKAQALLGMIEERAGQIVDTKLNELRDAHEVSTLNTQITKVIGENLEANPMLKAIPQIDQLIRFEVSKMQPESHEQLVEAINAVTQGIVEGLNETYNKTRSAALIKKEQIAKEGIEPPVGAPVNNIVQKEENFMLPGGKYDWKALARKAKATLA